ncbi:DUF6456 domain-containing protein [Ancylobacter sp. A5.8]|uniref:DUF6456 domain-containing protein n=1 Tax=Ancylobacter gelatini TaxID=2919920 RepID=UPI001F4ECBCF|nr:DUF6456 domain-containing protein [Ancylobacter gelatini]MCJ8143795.1 DUF6456 domain-containing protein [Ancylobacter gelatini]
MTHERRMGTVEVELEGVLAEVAVDLEESPLAWLASRRARDGRALIAPLQLLAGERLRADFTRAQMMPRMSADWSGVGGSGGRRGATGMNLSDVAIAAKQRLSRALEAAGPEFSGLLLDVCCFLKGMEQVERERRWPARTAKIVLGLGLDRLARHYGLVAEMRGPERARLQSWSAPADGMGEAGR